LLVFAPIFRTLFRANIDKIKSRRNAKSVRPLFYMPEVITVVTAVTVILTIMSVLAISARNVDHGTTGRAKNVS